MAGKLAGYVSVTVNSEVFTYGPDDEVPAEHAALITNPNAWADAPSVELAATPDGERSSDAPKPPPLGGAGSSRDEWAAYAAALGGEVEDDATRDEIVAALKAAGHPTE